MSRLQYLSSGLPIPPHHFTIVSTNRIDFYYLESLTVGGALPAGVTIPTTSTQMKNAGAVLVASLHKVDATGDYGLVFNSQAYS